MVKPNRLQKGDTVGVIAPASPPDKENLERGIRFLTELGLNVKIGKYIGGKLGYLAGEDQERLEDFHEMFLDKEIKAIFCACGGYGTGRIAASIDYQIVRNNPKIFWGYSDITFLHTAIRQQTGLVTFHGPMLGSDIGKEDTHPMSKEGFRQLFHQMNFTYTEQNSQLDVLIEGRATGDIIGGNLSLLISTLGTKFEIQTKNRILFIEDIHEEPRSVDRMLNQLYMSGKLEDSNGMVIGDFCECSPKREPSLSIDDVISHYVSLANKPALKGFQIGHCNPNIAIPFGVRAELNTFEKKLTVDSGVI
ncbi:LD-carboxypeptidase [Bacillus sp. BRMEA1]|uniref:S66 peptidase family protein n=1 Tax=Neobacillus endophyticus TaxID=2738405 RepID=UPI001565E84C|nr:LD-carboxypeptidase [Neobacillus endophyticus]NRD79254.1 LD-carboxypeptidase [Neobacillus endophyticus]